MESQQFDSSIFVEAFHWRRWFQWFIMGSNGYIMVPMVPIIGFDGAIETNGDIETNDSI